MSSEEGNIEMAYGIGVGSISIIISNNNGGWHQAL
jgi:hypothetical protein